MSTQQQENPYFIKHLEFIQLTLIRMAANSFLLKGWAVTFVVAILAFTSTDHPKNASLIALVPCLLFWYLDGFFLAQERRYRDLYNTVRLNPTRPLSQVDFSLDTSPFNPQGNWWQKTRCKKSVFRCLTSLTIASFYGVLMIIVLTVWFSGNPDACVVSKEHTPTVRSK